MKASRLSSMLFGAALFVAGPILAGNTVKKSLQISESVTVQGVRLAPGNYKFEWTEPGPDVQVKILRGSDTIATVPGHVVQGKTSNGQDGYALKPGADGQSSLSEVFFSGGKYDLQLDQGSNNPSGN